MRAAGYRVIRRLAQLLLGLFYRRVEVVGIEHVPAQGPLIVAANHQNALVDPMLLLATLPRDLRPVAKAPLFRHPLLGPFLRLAGALPAHRPQDPGSDPTQNVVLFRAATATLADGGAILIFPEGVSQAEPTLMPLRTGTARMVLDAERGPGGGSRVTLLPVGLVFQEPGIFRAGQALVLVGAPLLTQESVALARTAPEMAVRQLTAHLDAALRGLIVEAEDRDTLGLVRLVETIWREEAEDPEPADQAARAGRAQAVLRAYRYLAPREPARLARLRQALEAYARDLSQAGLVGRQLTQAYPPGTVARYALREGLSLFAGLPAALWGLLSHVLPYRLTGLATRLGRPSADTEATFKLASAVVLYPLCWIAEGWAAWRLGGGRMVGIFATLLVPTGLVALAWRERLDQVRRDGRGFVRLLASRDLVARLRARRRALMAELVALADLVPPPVLAGPGDPRPEAPSST